MKPSASFAVAVLKHQFQAGVGLTRLVFYRCGGSDGLFSARLDDANTPNCTVYHTSRLTHPDQIGILVGGHLRQRREH